jgi:hypothetical protein
MAYYFQVNENLVLLSCHAKHNPQNFAHRLTLVESELARVKGLPMSSTLEKYLLAIE